MDRILVFLVSSLGKRILIALVIFITGLRFDVLLVLIPFVFWPWKRTQ
ncbi:MAG: hypothetical protein HQ528_10325 [Candidatus Marinimicrobia bacterium]|nr:hypothetical protein [Candidatus Neomarinimicrobiota bacterium]